MSTTTTQPTFPTTMRAWTFTTRGTPTTTLSLTSNLPTPSPSTLAPNELLIHTSHASLNLFSSLLAWVVPYPLFRPSTGSVLETDFSGRVAALGPTTTITDLQIGDAVFGILEAGHHIKRGRGALAEYIIATRDEVVAKPHDTTFAEAAALATVGKTAMWLVKRAKLQRGDRVFVNGGSGGVGLSVLQIVKRVVGEEGWVVTSCSAGSVDLVKRMGADEVVDYTKVGDMPGYLRGEFGGDDDKKKFAAILDTVGTGQSQAMYNASPAYLQEKGSYLTVGTPMGDGLSLWNILRNFSVMIQNNAWPRLLGGTPRHWEFVDSSEGGPEVLEELRAQMDRGEHTATIDGGREWGFEEAMGALDRLYSRRAKGKVVVKVQDA